MQLIRYKHKFGFFPRHFRFGRWSISKLNVNDGPAHFGGISVRRREAKTDWQ